MKLGILDQSIIHHQMNSKQALDMTLQSALLAEKLGYERFWVSEHHNSNKIAGTTPDVLISYLASHTAKIKLGSGGVMLPNHSEFKVAESFRMLETLFPGRIDLGLGRAPGGDRVSSQLLNPSNDFKEEDYVRQLQYLQYFFDDEVKTQSGHSIYAMPRSEQPPQQWILSSSGGTSNLAAKFGMGLAVAKFINGNVHPRMVADYKAKFQPSERFAEPRVLVATVVLCGETEEHTAAMRKCVDFAFLQLAKGDFNQTYSLEYMLNYRFDTQEQAVVDHNANRVISGTPNVVKTQLDELAATYEADEIMVTNMAPQHELRLRSFELLAELY